MKRFKFFDHAEHEYVPDASDSGTRYALKYALEDIERYANTRDAEQWESATEFMRLASHGVMEDLGVI